MKSGKGSLVKFVPFPEGISVVFGKKIPVEFVEGISVVFGEKIPVEFVEGISVAFAGIPVKLEKGAAVAFSEKISVKFVEGLSVNRLSVASVWFSDAHAPEVRIASFSDSMARCMPLGMACTMNS